MFRTRDRKKTIIDIDNIVYMELKKKTIKLCMKDLSYDLILYYECSHIAQEEYDDIYSEMN